MFRWPIRNIEGLFLGLSVLLAVLLSAGFRTDHLRRRILITGGALLAGTYLAVASWPKISSRHLAGLLLLAALTALFVLAARRGNSRWLASVLSGGTLVVLLLQTYWSPINNSVTTYYPTPQAHLPYQGTVAQIGDVMMRPQRGLLFGNGYAAAGVPSLMSYTGIGYVTFSKALCLSHRDTCREGYDRLFAPVQGDLTLADLTRVETVVVQRRLVDAPVPKPGWRVDSRDDMNTVLRREKTIQYPRGRVSAWSPGVTVDDDTMDGSRSERVRFHRARGAAELTFARLAWPGYQAEVNGRKVPVREGPAGLLTVDLPDGVDSGELRLAWTPPGFWFGIISAIAGLALALSLTVRRRNHQRPPGPVQGQPTERPVDAGNYIHSH